METRSSVPPWVALAAALALVLPAVSLAQETPPPVRQEPVAPAAAAAPAAPAATAEQAPEPWVPGASQPAPRDPVGARLIDVPTPYTVGRHKFELLFTHRFVQAVNQGGNAHNLWGLDNGADVGIGVAFGLFRHLDLSVYRASFEEDFELATKLQLLDQGPRVPLSIAVRAGADLLGPRQVANRHRPFAQLLLGTHLVHGVNLFVSPSWERQTPLLHNAFNVPIGLTVPLPAHLLLEGEAIPPIHRLKGSLFAWHAALGKAIGGHIFQVLAGNSRATTVDQYLAGDSAAIFKRRDVRLGFNLVRYFGI